MQIIDRLTSVFNNLFNDDITLSREMTANDVDDWDSLMHVTLVLTIEKEFEIRFTSTEVSNLNNVGALIDMIEQKIGK